MVACLHKRAGEGRGTWPFPTNLFRWDGSRHRSLPAQLVWFVGLVKLVARCGCFNKRSFASKCEINLNLINPFGRPCGLDFSGKLTRHLSLVMSTWSELSSYPLFRPWLSWMVKSCCLDPGRKRRTRTELQWRHQIGWARCSTLQTT